MCAYTFNEHRHRFAIWTAARAVQRGFCTTPTIQTAINASGLRQFVESDGKLTTQEFESLHRRWANELIDAFEIQNIICSYGRAAKIIAIYLKTSLILCNQGSCHKSELIHPPIDSILLENLYTKKKIKELRSIKWTGLEEDDYWNLISLLKKHVSVDWRLERYWDPAGGKNKNDSVPVSS